MHEQKHLKQTFQHLPFVMIALVAGGTLNCIGERKQTTQKYTEHRRLYNDFNYEQLVLQIVSLQIGLQIDIFNSTQSVENRDTGH